jgi:hypothetical protein
VNVTTYALRWIDKAGGLDAYLLNTTPQKLMSYKALELRKRVLDAKGIKESEWKRPPGGVGGQSTAAESERGGRGGGGGGGRERVKRTKRVSFQFSVVVRGLISL